MALSRLQIKNMALDELPEQQLDNEDDGNLAAEVMARVYQPAFELLIEDHDWDHAVVRETLAVLTNDRAHEWEYAYQLPADVARPVRLLPWAASDVADAVPGYSVHGRLRGFEGNVPYRISGTTLYANRDAAVFEYISSTPNEARFSAKFARALALECAARAVMPIKKDSKRQGELISMAETARERAKAEDMNRDSETPRDFIPEVQLARMGVIPWP